MSENKKNVVANGALITGIGLVGASNALDLPLELTDFSEPIGLIFSLIGAILKVVQYFRARE